MHIFCHYLQDKQLQIIGPSTSNFYFSLTFKSLLMFLCVILLLGNGIIDGGPIWSSSACTQSWSNITLQLLQDEPAVVLLWDGLLPAAPPREGGHHQAGVPRSPQGYRRGLHQTLEGEHRNDWWIDRLTNCKIVELKDCWIARLINWNIVDLKDCWIERWLNCKIVELQDWLIEILLIWKIVELKDGWIARLLNCKID